MADNVHIYPVDAVDLQLKLLSRTSLNATVILPANSGAHYTQVHLQPANSEFCSVYAPPYTCTYKGLKPGHEYTFAYRLASIPGGLDIYSNRRYKSITIPS